MPDALIRSEVIINLIFYICEQNLYQQINNASKMQGGLDHSKTLLSLDYNDLSLITLRFYIYLQLEEPQTSHIDQSAPTN